jgi:toxin ParE1/3/4
VSSIWRQSRTASGSADVPGRANLPQRLEISLAAAAVADLEELRGWYAGQGAADAGERLLREVIEHIERLGQYPRSGRVVPEFGSEGLREVICPPFRIVYRLDDARVRVVRVWRSERSLRIP